MKSFKKAAVFAVVVTSALGAGIAFAAWTADGTGTGTAKAITAQAVTLTAGNASAQLYPGGTGDVVVTVNNPNPYPIKVTAYAGNGAITSDKGTACDASTGVTFTPVTGRNDVVAAGSSAEFTLTGAVAMSNSSDSTCQGATFTVPLAATAASNAP